MRKIMYECDICHRMVDRNYMRKFIKTDFSDIYGHSFCKMHICIGCLSVWRALTQTPIEEWKTIDGSQYYEE